MTDMTVKLERPIYGIEQEGRQFSRLLRQTLVEDIGMVQCEADPGVFKMGDAGDVCVHSVVNVDDILISDAAENVRKVGTSERQFPHENSRRGHVVHGVHGGQRLRWRYAVGDRHYIHGQDPQTR